MPSSRAAPRFSSRRSISTKWSGNCSPRRASARSRNWRWWIEKEIAGIEGFDDDTARELQERAKEYLDKLEGELDAKRVELGVEDAVKDVPGVTTKILVASARTA